MIKDLVSILIVTYNTQKITRQCIDSIFEHENQIDFEVILWDNASVDGSKEEFSNDSRIKYIYSEENLGFPEANNRALKLSQGEFILYLNSDTVCHSNSISKLLLQYKECLNLSRCALAPTLLNDDGTLQKSFFQFPTLIKTLIGALGLHSLASQIFSKLNPRSNFVNNFDAQDDLFDTDYAILACNLIKKEYIELVGFLDKNYFFYHDDCDFGYKLNGIGIQQKIFKGSKITHLGGKSSSSFDIFRVENYYKSILYFYFKYSSPRRYIIFGVLFAIVFLLRTIGSILRLRFSIAVPSSYVLQDQALFFPRVLWKSAIYTNASLIFAVWAVRKTLSKG